MTSWWPIVSRADPFAIYHITSACEVEQAAGTGEYAPAEFDADGFVHCSYAHQVIAVANARYRRRAALVLVEIDPSRVPARVVDENLEGRDELFPHIYGHVPMSAVLAVHDFPCERDGDFALPAAVRAVAPRPSAATD